MHWFYSETEFSLNSEIILSKEESFHLNKVLRLTRGMNVGLINGIGQKAQATIIFSDIKKSIVKVCSIERSRNSKIHMCLGISKSIATEIAIKKCSELGCASFTFLITFNSIPIKFWNITRWRKILIEVCKQSENPHLPSILPPLSFNEWLKNRINERPLLFFDENSRNNFKLPSSDVGYDIVIGPEGGWRNEERKLVADNGGIFLGLGASRLRCETAAIVALALIKKEIGEL